MFEPNPENKSKPRLAWIVSISLLTELILFPLVNLIQIPMAENKTGIISLAVVKNVSPYTDYLKYIILLLTPALITTLFLNLKTQTLNQITSLILNVIQSQTVWKITSLILLTAWLINVPFDQFTLNDILIDSFHQGEFLGFLPNFMQLEKPWINTVLVHGWGMDVFPSLLAYPFIFNQNGIALTRFWVNLENVITCLGYFWIFWELISVVRPHQSRWGMFLISCLFFCIFDGIFYQFDGRRGTVFILQFALLLRFFRIVLVRSKQAQAIAILLGASLPASFLYVYDRGIYFLAVYLFSSILVLFQPHRKSSQTWFIGLLMGGSLSSIIIIAFIGLDQVSAIASQVAYWGKYGRYISFIPLPNFELTWVSLNFWFPILIQSAVIVYLILDLKSHQFHLQTFIQNNTFLLLLLIPSMVYMRITLDRSDLGHAYQGAIPTVFLIAYLVGLAYSQSIESQIKKYLIHPIQKIFIAIIFLLLILIEPGFNPQAATAKLINLPSAISQPDQTLLKPDYQEAWQTLQSEISQQSCFFTLTSEGLWYYLFDKPSCSKYGYVLYAKPPEAQQSVIQELEKKQPDIILLKNDIWFQNPWDKILKSESASQIYQYVLQQYRPYKAIESHWFWKQDNQNLIFNTEDKADGSIDLFPQNPIQRNDEISLLGWAILPQQNKPADAVYLSIGEQNQLIAVGQVNLERLDIVTAFSEENYQKSGWTIRVPTAILPEGSTLLKVWAYDAAADELMIVGEEFIEIKKTSS